MIDFIFAIAPLFGIAALGVLLVVLGRGKPKPRKFQGEADGSMSGIDLPKSSRNDTWDGGGFDTGGDAGGGGD